MGLIRTPSFSHFGSAKIAPILWTNVLLVAYSQRFLADCACFEWTRQGQSPMRLTPISTFNHDNIQSLTGLALRCDMLCSDCFDVLDRIQGMFLRLPSRRFNLYRKAAPA